MSVQVFVLLGVGLALLVAGAELFVRGAARLAILVGISPLVIGLTVVALGTSSPEIAVSVQASTAGQGDLALGNVIGSNIFNVLFILGLSAILLPLVVSQQLVRLDVPVMIAAAFLLILLTIDGRLGLVDGGILLLAGASYVVFLIVVSRRQGVSAQQELATEQSAAAGRGQVWAKNAGLILVGLAMLILGSRWLVSGAVTIAESLGVSQLIIGLTVVAAGTSLPEVATSVIAALRGERDIAVGNVVGSNIFNILIVLGLASLVAPDPISVPASVLRFDLPVMTAVAVACLPIFFTGHRIDRWEGALFLAYYVAYTMFLVLAASGHDALPAYSAVMLSFVLPLTVLTLLVVVWRSMRAKKQL
ncbi:MAG: calcium/sodium antiporter [Gemmatimonadetes bacterium]|nr:calcium/sodium antiporter [Gemmatimonadota bacterium]